MSPEVRHIPAGDGPLYYVLGGDQITIKASSDDTGGALTVVETTVPPQAGPPPHVHHRESESFYVLEGEFEFYINGETIRATGGDYLFAPLGTPHRFRNVGVEPGKLLIVCQPGGFDKFVEDFSQIPVDSPPDPAQLAAIGAKHGIEFVDE